MTISKITSKSITDATITADDIATGAVESSMTTQIGGRRNLIINGAMQVAQRGTQVTGFSSGDGYKTSDRWKYLINTLGTWTIDQSTDAPNGFSSSLKTTCTTADASPASGDYMMLIHYIEAQDLQHLGFGTVDAKPMTLSFWVKSNKTGNGSTEIRQSDNGGKHVTPTYTINSANTWEYKTISIPADTAGVINNDNGRGLELFFWINSGTGFSSGTNTTVWATPTNANRNASNLGVGGAVNDYFAITGVQLEVGSVATPFEHRSYGEELALCQRYYYRHADHSVDSQTMISNVVAYSGSATFGNVFFPVSMRANPSLDFDTSTSNCLRFYKNGSYTNFNGDLGSQSISRNGFIVSYPIGDSSIHPGWIQFINTGHLSFNAEL